MEVKMFKSSAAKRFSSNLKRLPYQNFKVIFDMMRTERLTRGLYGELDFFTMIEPNIDKELSFLNKIFAGIKISDSYMTVKINIQSITNKQLDILLFYFNHEYKPRVNGIFYDLPPMVLIGIFELLDDCQRELEILRTLTNFEEDLEFYYSNKRKDLIYKDYPINSIGLKKFMLLQKGIRDLSIKHIDGDSYFNILNSIDPKNLVTLTIQTDIIGSDLTLLNNLINLEKLTLSSVTYSSEYEIDYKKSVSFVNYLHNLIYLSIYISCDGVRDICELQIIIDELTYNLASLSILQEFIINSNYEDGLEFSYLFEIESLKTLKIPTFYISQNEYEETLCHTNITNLHISNYEYIESLNDKNCPFLLNNLILTELHIDVAITRLLFINVLTCINLKSLTLAYFPGVLKESDPMDYNYDDYAEAETIQFKYNVDPDDIGYIFYSWSSFIDNLYKSKFDKSLYLTILTACPDSYNYKKLKDRFPNLETRYADPIEYDEDENYPPDE